MTVTERNAERELEAMVDRYSLSYILDMLAVICSEKSEHILESWQDKPLAKEWGLAAQCLSEVAKGVSV